MENQNKEISQYESREAYNKYMNNHYHKNVEKINRKVYCPCCRIEFIRRNKKHMESLKHRMNLLMYTIVNSYGNMYLPDSINRITYGYMLKKADEFYENGQCIKLNDVILASENAIKQSYSQQLTQLQIDQQSKVDGLQSQIDALKQQNQDATSLILEQKTAIATLNSIKAGDRNVINTITSNEQLKQSNIITSFFNSIVAFISDIYHKIVG